MCPGGWIWQWSTLFRGGSKFLIQRVLWLFEGNGSILFTEFQCFQWMNLKAKVLMEDVEISVKFLLDKGLIIDDAKCCDQLCNLNKFLEQNNKDLENKSCNDKWVKYLESTKINECHSELLKIAEYFFALPGHNANIKRVFFISALWTNERNHLNVDSIKSLLFVTYNFKHLSYSELYKYILKYQGILNKISSSNKYNWVHEVMISRRQKNYCLNIDSVNKIVVNEVWSALLL